MKRIAIAAAAALLMLGTAQAQQASASPLYGELGYTFLSVKGNGLDADPQALRGIIGYDVHRYLAVEGMLAFGVRKDTFFDFEENTVKLKHAFGLFVKPKYDFGNIEAFARLGWARTKVDFSCPSGLCQGSNDSDFAYGLGVNYRFNPKMHVGLDWARYQDKGGVKVDGWTIGFGYRF
jgi:opacity protein-like surface antigen